MVTDEEIKNLKPRDLIVNIKHNVVYEVDRVFVNSNDSIFLIHTKCNEDILLSWFKYDYVLFDYLPDKDKFTYHMTGKLPC